MIGIQFYVAGIALRHVCGAHRVGYRALEQVASCTKSPVDGVRSNDTRKSGGSDSKVRIPQVSKKGGLRPVFSLSRVVL